MGDQDMLIAEEIPELRLLDCWCEGIRCVAQLAHHQWLVDGDPGLDSVSVEGVRHSRVVLEPG